MKSDSFVSASSSTINLRYRSFTSADIPAAHGLSSSIGWPHRAEDWQFAADEGAGFVAEEDGAVIGTALCWKFGTDRASLGLVIVSSEHQGRGIGRKLMEMVLEELGPRTTFLHATPVGQPLYEKLGFNVCGSLDQFQGNVVGTLPVALSDGEQLRAATPADSPDLIELCSCSSGLQRDAMVSGLLKIGESVVLERDGEIIGFSVLRRFGRGHVIGPVVASPSHDDLRAKALIGYWLAGREGEYVRVDVPSGTSLPDWLLEQGLKRVDTVVKMVRNAPADEHNGASEPAWQLYGLISQAML
ncbi:GNAT family N-acetyltransferase [Burkholderia cepacia]|uniref:GNAT family N-acetyltransferase n=1 Tax=Burkholderia cepacia TaxID=292 RepID=UPI001F1FD177|nr:GNAT family N-acetyltransferase [Burkholderia cepacia]MCE4124483.1 GNAT family N-acetyltransferase [Burkholderia cepacia]